MDRFSRTEMLLGRSGMEILSQSTVGIFGIGGVGSFAAEALARSGVGHLVLIDPDDICLTNINRQIHAATSTVGRKKTAVMKERILDINPDALVDTLEEFYLPEKAEKFFSRPYDYIVDAIDTVTGKISLVLQCKARQIPLISCMGAGNKLDPTRFEVADIYETKVDPLARVLRKKLREHGVQSLKVVYSQEIPLTPEGKAPEDGGKKPPGSISFVPSVAGLLLAGEVIKDLLQK